jgi:ubiquinone/menaquinone biosynthesis C-methylase UbiE
MAKDVRKVVRKKYSKIAKGEQPCCGRPNTCCNSTPESASKKMGYADDDVKSVPKGANLGLGCGNPVALASLKEGETVLDLGSGGGFDCFLASKRVGKEGKVIGVDMTPEMLEKARANARKGGYKNVEFRLGEIENLPVADGSVDIVISNCVINLSPDKERVFDETYRVLREGGRLMISDIVLHEELPDFVKKIETALTGCVAGAMIKEEYLKAIEQVGFRGVKVVNETKYSIESILNDPEVKAAIKRLRITKEQLKKVADSVWSIKVCGIKS